MNPYPNNLYNVEEDDDEISEPIEDDAGFSDDDDEISEPIEDDAGFSDGEYDDDESDSYYSEGEGGSFQDPYLSSQDGSFRSPEGGFPPPEQRQGFLGSTTTSSSSFDGLDDSFANATAPSDFDSSRLERTVSSQDEVEAPRQQISIQDRAAAYRREFEELIELAENGQQLTPDEDDRLYCLELFARQRVGEALTEDERLDLEDWLEEETEKEAVREIEEDTRDNTQRAGNNRNTEQEGSDSFPGDESMVSPPDKLMAPKLWESSTRHGSEAMAGSQKLWESSTRHNDSGAMGDFSPNQRWEVSPKTSDVIAMEFLQQPDMVESENGSDSKQSESGSMEFDEELEEEGDQHEGPPPANAPMNDDASPQSPNRSDSPCDNWGQSKQKQRSPKNKEALDDKEPLDWGDGFGAETSPWDDTKESDWGDGFGDDPFGGDDAFGGDDPFDDFDGFGGEASERDDPFGKMQDPLVTESDSNPGDPSFEGDDAFGRGYGDAEHESFGGDTPSPDPESKQADFDDDQDHNFKKMQDPPSPDPESKQADFDDVRGEPVDQDPLSPYLEPNPTDPSLEGDDAFGGGFGAVEDEAFGMETVDQGGAFGAMNVNFSHDRESNPADPSLEGDSAFAVGFGEGEDHSCGVESVSQDDSSGKMQSPLSPEVESNPADSALGGDTTFGAGFDNVLTDDEFGGETIDQDDSFGKMQNHPSPYPESNLVDSSLEGDNAFGGAFDDVGQDGSFEKMQHPPSPDPESNPVDSKQEEDVAHVGGLDDVDRDNSFGRVHNRLSPEPESNPSDFDDFGREKSEQHHAFGKQQSSDSSEPHTRPVDAAFHSDNACGGSFGIEGDGAFGSSFGSTEAEENTFEGGSCGGAGDDVFEDFGALPSFGDDCNNGNENVEWNQESMAEDMEEQNDDEPRDDGFQINDPNAFAEKQVGEATSQQSTNAANIDGEPDRFVHSEGNEQTLEEERSEISAKHPCPQYDDAFASTSQVLDLMQENLIKDSWEAGPALKIDVDAGGRLAQKDADSSLHEQEVSSAEPVKPRGDSFAHEDGSMSNRQEAVKVPQEKQQEADGFIHPMNGSSAPFEGKIGALFDDAATDVKNDMVAAGKFDHHDDGNSQSRESQAADFLKPVHPSGGSSQEFTKIQGDNVASDTRVDLGGKGDTVEREGTPMQLNDHGSDSQNSGSISNMSQVDDWSDLEPPSSGLLSPQSIGFQGGGGTASSNFDDAANHIDVPDGERMGDEVAFDTKTGVDSVTQERTMDIESSSAVQEFDEGPLEEIWGEDDRETEISNESEVKSRTHMQGPETSNQTLVNGNLQSPAHEKDVSGDESICYTGKETNNTEVVHVHSQKNKRMAPGWAGLLVQSSFGQGSDLLDSKSKRIKNDGGSNEQARIANLWGTDSNMHGPQGTASNHEEQASQSFASEMIGEEGDTDAEEEENVVVEDTLRHSDVTFESEKSEEAVVTPMRPVSPAMAARQDFEAFENKEDIDDSPSILGSSSDNSDREMNVPESKGQRSTTDNVSDGLPIDRNHSADSMGDEQPFDAMREQTASSDGSAFVMAANEESATSIERRGGTSVDQGMGDKSPAGSKSSEDNAAGNSFASIEGNADIKKVVIEGEADGASFHSADNNLRSSTSQNVVIGNEKQDEHAFFKSPVADDRFGLTDSWGGGAPGFDQDDEKVLEGEAAETSFHSDDNNSRSSTSQNVVIANEKQDDDHFFKSPVADDGFGLTDSWGDDVPGFDQDDENVPKGEAAGASFHSDDNNSRSSTSQNVVIANEKQDEHAFFKSPVADDRFGLTDSWDDDAPGFDQDNENVPEGEAAEASFHSDDNNSRSSTSQNVVLANEKKDDDHFFKSPVADGGFGLTDSDFDQDDENVPEGDAAGASFHSGYDNSRSSTSQNVVIGNEKKDDHHFFKSSVVDDGFDLTDSSPVVAWGGDAPGFNQDDENMDGVLLEEPVVSQGHFSGDSNEHSNDASENSSRVQSFSDGSQASESIVDSPVPDGEQKSMFHGEPKSSYGGDADKSIETSIYLSESSHRSADDDLPFASSADDWSVPETDADSKPQDERGPSPVESEEIENVNNNSSALPNSGTRDSVGESASDEEFKVDNEPSTVGFNRMESVVKADQLATTNNETRSLVDHNNDMDSQSVRSQHSTASSSKETSVGGSWDPHATFQTENRDPELPQPASKEQRPSSNSSHSEGDSDTWSEFDEPENAIGKSIQSLTTTNGHTNRSVSHSTKMSTASSLRSQMSFPEYAGEAEQASETSTRSERKEAGNDGAESVASNAQKSISHLQLSKKFEAGGNDQEAGMQDERSRATNGDRSNKSDAPSKKYQMSEGSINLGEVFGKSESFFSDNKVEEPKAKEDPKAKKGLSTIASQHSRRTTNESQHSQRSVSQRFESQHSRRSVSQRSQSRRSQSQHKSTPQIQDETRTPSVRKKKVYGGKRSPSWRKANMNNDRRGQSLKSSKGQDKKDIAKPRKMRTPKEIEERRKKRLKRKRVKKEAKSPALLAFVASVNSAMLELEKIEEELKDENLEETSAHQLLNGFDALMGIFLQLSDEIELMSTFAGLKKKKENDTITSYHALKEVLSFAESLDQLFADLKPIILNCFAEEPDEEMEDMLFRLNSLVDLLCETSHRVGQKQEWNDRAETTYVTLLELMELETLELQCYFENVDVPEQGISANIHEAWSATGHMEELQALELAANDPLLFRQLCYEVMVSTDQWCPDVDTLMEICDIDPDILEEEPDPEYLEEEDLAPIPRAAEHILDKINGDPLPRSEALAAILRRILPPRAMTDLTLLDNFTSIRNTLDNPLGLSATNLVAITSAPEVLNDPSALGVAGVGKTTLAAMVAEHPDVRRYFIDGVVWIYVGDKELTYSRYTQCLRDLVAQLDFYDGVPLFAELIHTPGECLTKRRRREEGFMIYARDTIVELLEDRSVLIILDDVCFEPDLDWFDFTPMPEGSQDDQGTDVALLVSTRARDLLPAADTVEVDMLDEADAIALLIQESGQLSHTLMAESKEAISVVRECANHPLAVKSVGRWLGLKHVTAGAVSSAEEIHAEVVKSMEKILKGGVHSGTDMMYEILSLSLSPAINGEATNIIKYCFAAFVIVFCDKEHISEFALTEPTPIVPMGMAQLLFETLLEINESALLQEGSLFYAQKKEAAVLIPEALSALGVLKVGTYSDEDEHEELDGDQKFLQVVHSIHHEYGEYLCFEEPALKMLTRDAEQEWNRALAEASVKDVDRWDDNLDDAGHGYVLEMIVSHMIRGAMYNEASDLLANKGFVRGRLMSLGRECATRRHIKDCVLLSTKLSETRSKISKLEQRSIMKRAYHSLGSQLTMEYDIELVEDARMKDIDIARSHYEIGFSLAEHRCWDAAIAHWESSQQLLENALGTVEVVAGIMYNIGVSYAEMNEYDQALNAIKQCLRIRGAIHGEHHILYAQTIQKIGDIFLGMSDYNEAVESYDWALEVMNREPALHRVGIGEILDNKGSIHRSKGELEESLKSHREALRSKQMDLGEDHPELVVTYQHIGNCLSEQGNDDDAIVHLEEAIRLKELDLDGGAEGESDILTLEGFILFIERNQEQGLECYEKALQILVTKAPYRKEKIAYLLHLIGCVYLTGGEHRKAIKMFQESLRGRRKVLGYVHLDVASTLFNMAFLYKSRNRLDKALRCLEEALKIRALRVPETETVAMTHEKIGSLCRAIGKMKKAQIEFETALRLRKMIHGKDHIKVASVLQELGDLMDDIGEYGQALIYYMDALDIRRAKLENSHVAVAETLYSMGYTLHTNGQLDRALTCFDESLSIRKYQLGDDSKEVGDTLNMMGFLKASRGDLEEALTILWDALRIRKKQKDKIKVSETLNNIGNVHREKKDYDVAVQCYEECLRIRRAELGEEHEKVADSLIALGNIYGDTKKNEEAMQAYQEALKIRTKVFGERDERVATVLQYMGTVEFRSANQDRARDLFTEFIKIRKENNAMNDSDYVNVLFTIGNIHKLQGNQAQARQCWTEAYQTFLELGLEETNPKIASMMNELILMDMRDDDKADQRRNAALSFLGKITKRPTKDPDEPQKDLDGKNRQAGNAIQL
ncbi:unnamed protein product [Cylindrotheca closterium]|uniref:NB-ARC domain-containing protein n=1 Tax=Cylindrotheca closterium TaxID=2856 RepID=A0AAD2CN77_9STRA|nr:unnamed protein product [Cylindrotheca closterium]